MKHHRLFAITMFLVAFLLRCILINWTLQYGNNGDFTRYEDWARIAHIYNFADTYTTVHLSVWKSFPNNQPPGSLYMLSASYELWILAGRFIAHTTHTTPGSLLWVNTYLQHICMKIPSLITDMLMGFLVYLLVTKEAGRKKGLFAAALVLFNPVLIFNSAIWGQMDSINNFFFLLAILFAFRKNTIISLLSFAISLYIKLSLLPLVPFYLVFLYFSSEKNLKKITAGIVVSCIVWVIATVPISPHPSQWLGSELPIIARGEIQSVTVAAFNFWFGITCLPTACKIPDVTNTFLRIPFSMWGYGIFTAFSLPLLFMQIKKYKALIKMQHIFLLLACIALLAFLFLPGMHDRYMYPVFPLLAIAVVLSKQWKLFLVFYVLLTLFNLDNIVYSWYPVVFNSTTTFYHVFYGPWLRWIISILTTITGLGFYIVSLRRFILSKES